VATIQQDNIGSATQGDVVLYDDGLFGLVGADGIARTKTGLTTMQELATLCCKVVSVFAPYLRQNLPNSAIILILLDLIDVLCKYLSQQVDFMQAQRDFEAQGVDTAQLLADLQRIVQKVADIESGVAPA